MLKAFNIMVKQKGKSLAADGRTLWIIETASLHYKKNRGGIRIFIFHICQKISGCIRLIEMDHSQVCAV